MNPLKLINRNNLLCKPNQFELRIRGPVNLGPNEYLNITRESEGFSVDTNNDQFSVDQLELIYIDDNYNLLMSLTGPATIEGEIIITDRGILVDNDWFLCEKCNEKMPCTARCYDSNPDAENK